MSDKLDNVLETLVHLFQEKKAEHIIAYRMNDTVWITDFACVVTAKNTVHAKAMAEEVAQQFGAIASVSPKDFYDRPNVTGSAASGWIVLDMNSIVVHVVTEAMRDFYKLDAFFEKRGVAFHY